MTEPKFRGSQRRHLGWLGLRKKKANNKQHQSQTEAKFCSYNAGGQALKSKSVVEGAELDGSVSLRYAGRHLRSRMNGPACLFSCQISLKLHGNKMQDCQTLEAESQAEACWRMTRF